MIKLSQQQIDAVLRLDGPERYRHFIKQIADRDEVWGLYDEGWAMAGTDSGEEVLPFWPAPEYATLCAAGSWEGYQPRRLTTDEFFDLLERLEVDGVLPGVFYTPTDKGVVPPHEQLREDLEAELEQYE